jgi:predicted esterase
VGGPRKIRRFFRSLPPAPRAAGPLPAGRRKLLQTGRHRWWPLLLALTFTPPVAADRVDLDDGRSLLGRFALLPGINVDPEEREGQAATAVMCDDGLTRTFVPRRRVVAVEKSPVNAGLERIEIPQRVPEGGRRVGGIGGILAATPFDEYGRRILSLATAAGRLDVVQGITTITPQWTAVEGLVTDQTYRIDMRLATSSIPRETLRRVIEQQIDQHDIDQRLQFVRLLLQATRYREAAVELEQLTKDFPNATDLRDQQQSLAGLAAGQLLDEIRLRQRAGQDRLVIQLLESFPAGDGTGELLQAVAEIRDEYRERLDRAGRLVALLREQAGRIEDARDRQLVADLTDEIAAQLTFTSLNRLAVFERVAGDGQLTAEQSLALGLSGWLAGADRSQINLKLALSMAQVRRLLREYLTASGDQRVDLRRQLADEEAFDPPTVAAVAAQMLPPLPAPEPDGEGLFTLNIPRPAAAESSAKTFPCLVQLPPEYDARRRYPAIISLHAAWTTPLNQIEWWAGMPDKQGRRSGQAARNGTIVIAPAWADANQQAYGFTAKEHAAVLAALREASRRFSIDSDRVFLSGHSLGGDAAWDIGLAHPDLWAGVVVIAGKADRYINHYHPNAELLPLYLVSGELDQASFTANEMDIDRYLVKNYDITYVEFRGRGHEHFSDEIIRIFDWMSRRKRNACPRSIEAVALRPGDRFFWWIEPESPPPRTMILPSDWPAGAAIRPFTLSGKVTNRNRVTIRCGAKRVRIWFTPELVDFKQPVTVTLGGRQLHRGELTPDIDVMLEDLRTRSDYQHPFWAVIDSARTGVR